MHPRGLSYLNPRAFCETLDSSQISPLLGVGGIVFATGNKLAVNISKLLIVYTDMYGNLKIVTCILSPVENSDISHVRTIWS